MTTVSGSLVDDTTVIAEPDTPSSIPMGDASDSLSARVLVVEDDLALQEAIVDTLELAGCEVAAAPSAERALDWLQDHCVDMVISDVNMGGMDGHALLEKIRQRHPQLPVLLITAYGTIARSVSALKAGAVDYLVKPFEPQLLIQLVRCYALGIVTQSAKPIAHARSSQQLYQLAEKVAESDSTVLIEGDSGTGKEVLARFIHGCSTRADRPFVALNCAAIPEAMLESMLFGHEKGAYTGAYQSSPGKFEQADGGTLLLDEISEMDIALQAKLLRVIQEQEVERLGGRKTIPLDVRIIATTNRNLQAHVAAGKFREDLYYRLSVFPLRLLRLNQRIEDVSPIAQYLLQKHAAKMGRSSVSFSPAAIDALQGYSWPGNVRELDNIVQRALILQRGTTINANDLMFDTRLMVTEAVSKSQIRASEQDNVDENNSVAVHKTSSLDANLRDAEYAVIQQALSTNRGSRQRTAEQLKISPRTLRYKIAKMRELGMPVD